jgi:hypothetical protein
MARINSMLTTADTPASSPPGISGATNPGRRMPLK